jgi:hypothetical protein
VERGAARRQKLKFDEIKKEPSELRMADIVVRWFRRGYFVLVALCSGFPPVSVASSLGGTKSKNTDMAASVSMHARIILSKRFVMSMRIIAIAAIEHIIVIPTI